jgi:prolipoprotein diacylglyceryltransferase
MILYSIGRFFIEGLRTDSLYFGSFRVAQIVSMALVLVGIFLMGYLAKKKKD